MTVDTRFYDLLGPMTVEALAVAAGASVVSSPDPDRIITGVAPPAEAGPSDLVYLEADAAKAAQSVTAGAALVRPDAAGALDSDITAVLTADAPQAAFARACERLVQRRRLVETLDAHGDHGVFLGPGAVIAADAEIGSDVVVEAGAVVGPGVRLGDGVVVGPGAVVGCADLGARVRLAAGAVIGEAGFGLAVEASGPRDMPHVGRVAIEDHVSIGANSTVDRATFGVTRIGAGAKIDNLVHIAHNTQVGRGCVIAGCCGISGSVIIEDGAMLGGGVGVSDHVRIGAGARIAGGSGLVMRDVPAGETWAGGVPAKPRAVFLREQATLARLARAQRERRRP